MAAPQLKIDPKVARLPPAQQVAWSEKNGLAIPPFLRVASRAPQAAPQAAAAPAAAPAPSQPPPVDPRVAKLPAAVQQHVLAEERAGRLRLHWLDDPGTLAMLLQQLQEKEDKRNASMQRLRELRQRAPKKVNPLAGLVPLRVLLEELAKVGQAMSRGQAKAAVDAAKLEHTAYHFQPGQATLERVRVVLRSYQPPPRKQASAQAKVQYSGALVISWSGTNPKKPGSSAHARWQLLQQHHGKTVDAFVAAGGNPVTLHNAVVRGTVVLGADAAKPEKKPAAPKTAAKPVAKPAAKSKPKKRGKK